MISKQNLPECLILKTRFLKEMDSEILKMQCPEELCSIKEEDLVVWVDPLDGTAEYTEGNHLFYSFQI